MNYKEDNYLDLFDKNKNNKRDSKSTKEDNLILDNNIFYNLLSNKTFRKFLDHKLKYNGDNEDQSQKKFIQSLSYRKNNKLKKYKENENENENLTNAENEEEILPGQINYSLFYNEDNYKSHNYNKISQKIKNKDMLLYSPRNYDNYINNIKINCNNRYNDNIENHNNTLTDGNIPMKSQIFTNHNIFNNIKNNNNANINDNNNLIMKNKELYDKILELQNEIRLSKNEINEKDSELKKYCSTFDKVCLENNLNKEKIENLKEELKNQKDTMNEKMKKINDLENINNILKKEMNKLQKNFETETSTNKETKQNYDIIKSNYNDIKNQYDLLNLKYQTLTDENFNFKRDKALYEKQIKTKNEMIESLLESNNAFLNKNIKININDKTNSITDDKTKTNHELFLDYLSNKNLNPQETKDNIDNKEDKENGKTTNDNDNDNGMDKNVNTDNKENIINEKMKNIDYSKFDKLTYPELQSKRDELVTERKNLNNIFNKIPIKIIYKGQIEKRNELEKKLSEINRDLAIIKLRMKNLKN